MANRPKPITSVYLDIADFLWTTEDALANGPEFTAKWLRDLRACLATRDPRKSEFGARLIEQAESFREDARQRKAASRARTVGNVHDVDGVRDESYQGWPHEQHDPNQPIDGQPQQHEQPFAEPQHGTMPERKKRAVFTVPTHDEIADFANDTGLPTTCISEFWDYYESKGWKVGNVKMSDWKAAYRGWVRRDVQMPSAQEVQKFCSEKGVDQTKARAFYRELSSVGWKYRGQKIVDWKPLFLELRA